MAFDRNNTADLIALRDEELNDPINMGYLAVDGITNETLSLFNQSANNVGLETGEDFLNSETFLKILFAENINSQDQFKLQLLFIASNGLSDDVSSFKSSISALSISLSDEITANTRLLSRAEVLFGVVDSNGSMEKVVISKQDWIAARDYQGV